MAAAGIVRRRGSGGSWGTAKCRAAASAVALVVLVASVAGAEPPSPYYHDASQLRNVYPDANIDRAPGGCLILTPAEFAAPSAASDPNYGWHFSQAVEVYAPRHSTPGKGYFRIASVHYEPEQRDQARRSACLIGRLWSAYRDHFGHDLIFPLQAQSADVYIAQQSAPGAGDVGGRTRNDCVYVFGAGVDGRTPLEWVRTMAHEWGHLTLAAARGYVEPEEDAAGYLGERLYLKWLRESEATQAADAPDDGTTSSDLELYFRRQVAPLIARFQDGGPGSGVLDGKDTMAMDYYIGGVLAVDDEFGSPVAGRALDTALDERPRSYLAALRTLIANRLDFTVQTPAWVPLRKGTYVVTRAGSSTAAAKKLHVQTSGWQRVSGGKLQIHRIDGAH